MIYLIVMFHAGKLVQSYAYNDFDTFTNQWRGYVANPYWGWDSIKRYTFSPQNMEVRELL